MLCSEGVKNSQARTGHANAVGMDGWKPPPKPKVVVKCRVVLNAKAIGDYAKLFDDASTVQVAVDYAMAKGAADVKQALVCERVEACTSEEGLQRQGTVLDSNDLGEMTVADQRCPYTGQ